MLKQVYMLDVTETSGNIREALREYAANTETNNGSFFELDFYDLMEYEQNEDNTEVKSGWQQLQQLCIQKNIFKFYVHYWW